VFYSEEIPSISAHTQVHLRELGERKRADAARAEADFFELLKETDEVVVGVSWSDVKRKISHDPRYDAVGSSSLRAELFETHMKKLATEQANETPEQAAERKLRERKERQAASLREREGQVRDLQAKVSEDVDKSRASAGREEGERLYGSLLVDVVRSHDVSQLTGMLADIAGHMAGNAPDPAAGQAVRPPCSAHGRQAQAV